MELYALDGTNGFQISGEAEYDAAGDSVSDAGDINGDGFADLIIGAVGADPNGSNSGASYVVFGHAGGFGANLDLSSLTGTNGFQISGEAEDDFLGYSVAAAGDVNGDGFDDLLISAPQADPNGDRSGASYVVFGHAGGFGANLNLSLLTGTNGFQISGEAAGDFSGQSVSTAGDVNGDGFDDLLIGASNVGGGAGASYVVFGQAGGFGANLDLSSLTGTNGFQISGEAGGDYSGHRVSAAGDVNGDGFDDVITGAVFADPNGSLAGASYVVFGQAGGFGANLELSALTGANGFQISGELEGDMAGWTVSGAGDVNGDGFDDVLIGATGADPNGSNSGASYVVFGQAGGFGANLELASLTGANGFQISGEAASDGSGISVSAAGDVNGDGFADLIIGAFQADPNGSTSGASYVVFGKASGFAANLELSSLTGANGFQISGEAEYDLAGISVSAAGDVNGDGFDDLLISARNDLNGDDSGASYVVFGSDLSDVVDSEGTTGDDNLTGDDNANVYVAGLGDDTLDGAGGGDVLKGGGGDDWLVGGAGKDRLFGGLGFDMVSYESESAAVTVNLGLGRVSGTSAGADLLDGVEGVVGSAFGDTLTGDGERNLLDGGAGDDTITGGAGDDALDGGAGEDTFIDKAGNDTLNGGADDDTFLVDYTGGALVNATGGTGRDTYFLNPNATGYTYRVTDFQGGPGGDLLDVGAILDASAQAGFYAGTDLFATGFLKLVQSGANTLVRWDYDGAGTAYGLVTGIKLLNVEASSITLENFLGLIVGTGSANTLGGSAEDNILVGAGGNDSLSGRGGDDQLFGGTGRDTMRGGTGSDTYQVDSINDKVIETSNGASLLLLPGSDPDGAAGPGLLDVQGITDTVIAAINFSVANLQYVENIVLTGAASLATGNALANALTGNSGSDTLTGAGGNDTLDGGAGNDVLKGGAGANTVSYHTATSGVTVGLALTGAQETGGAGSDTLFGFERLTGSSYADKLTGSNGNNVINGLGGDDTLNGGGANDTLVGGVGNDTYVVGQAGDVVTEVPRAGTDTVRSSVTIAALAANVENLTLTGTGAINGTGNTLSNTITGNSGANRLGGGGNTDFLVGSGGADTLNGGSGNDILDGGAGADRLLGDAGNDTLIWTGDAKLDGGIGTDTLKLSVNLDLTTLANTKFVNIEQINMTGGGSNVLTLDVTDVLDFSSSTDTLKVFGDEGDVVHRGSGWTQGDDLVILAGKFTYHTYTQGAATLWVDSDITSFI